MIKEKIKALLARQKPRDFFDLYFILRKGELRRVLKLQPKEREAIKTQLDKQKKEELREELKRLLPQSFWQVIKDLPQVLKKEL